MVVPFDAIQQTRFSNIAPGTGLASFTLSQPPQFYMENSVESAMGQPCMRVWKRCADWAEDTQATLVFRHDLIGPAIQLAQFIQTINQGNGIGVSLRTPAQSFELSAAPDAILPLPTGLAATMTEEYAHVDQLQSSSLALQLDSALRQRTSPFAYMRPSGTPISQLNRCSSAGPYPLTQLSTADALVTRNAALSQTASPSMPFFDSSQDFTPRNVTTDYVRLMPTSRPSTQGSMVSQGSDSYFSTTSSGSASPVGFMRAPITAMSMSRSHSPYGTPSPATSYTQFSWGGNLAHVPDAGSTYHQRESQDQHLIGQTTAPLPSLAYPTASGAIPYFQGQTF